MIGDIGYNSMYPSGTNANGQCTNPVVSALSNFPDSDHALHIFIKPEEWEPPYFISYKFSLWVDNVNYVNNLYGFTYAAIYSTGWQLTSARYKQIAKYIYQSLSNKSLEKMISCTETSYPVLVDPEIVKTQSNGDLQGFANLLLKFGDTYVAAGTEQSSFSVVREADVPSFNFEVGKQYKIDVEYELGAMITDTNVILY